MRSMKKYCILLSELWLCAFFLLTGCAGTKGAEEKKSIRIGVSLYRGNQNTQNDQVERFLALGCDVLCINPVDRTAASVLIDKAMAAQTPVIFFNRQPVAEDMDRWDRIFYVGAEAKASAVLQGSIVVDGYRENPEKLDLNGDGVVSYVLLEGESSHQDSLIRTEWSVQTLKDGGVPIEKLTGGIANGERSKASALMEQWLEKYHGRIELVICNNDDMALGAIDAMERAGMEGIAVVGIDGTTPGLAAVESGKLMGTVAIDRAQYAGAILAIATGEALGWEPDAKLEFEDGKYYQCPWQIVVKK